MSEAATFTGEGFEGRPPVYADNLSVAEYSNELVWTDELIDERIAQYQEFLKGDEMPRAREQATRIVTHLMFEKMYRVGLFNRGEMTWEKN